MSTDHTIPSGSGSSYTLRAQCPTGKVVISGGYSADVEAVNELWANFPRAEDRSWVVVADQDEDVDVFVKVFAVCVDAA